MSLLQEQIAAEFLRYKGGRRADKLHWVFGPSNLYYTIL